MTESAKLRIPYIAASQAQKHVTHNEGMTLLDTLVQLSVLDRDLNGPPVDPDEGDTYIVAGKEGDATATGAWLGWEGRVARFIDGEWRSNLPGQGSGAGWLAWVLDEDAMVRFDGTEWDLAGIEGPEGPPGPPGEDGEDGQSFQPDAVVALIGGRDAYDDEPAAFSVLVVSDSGNDDKPTLYFKLSAASADWSAGITFVPEGGGDGQGIVRGHIYGLTLSNNTSDAANDIDIAAGEATSDDGASVMVLETAITKRLDAAWAAGTGNGGRDTGSIANDTWHVWLIRRSDTGVVDVLFSLSATAPTMPADYDQKRRIGSIVRTGGAIVAFTQTGDEFLITPVNVLNTDSSGTSAQTLTLPVPAGIVVWAALSGTYFNSGSAYLLVTPLDVADTAPSVTVNTTRTTTGADAGVFGVNVRTNVSGQVRYRTSTSNILRMTLHGWIDRRGRLS